MQGFVDQHEGAPLIAKLGAQQLVKLDRFFVPAQNFPMHSVTVFLHRKPSDRSQQSLTDSFAPKALPYENIFQEKSAPTPGLVKVKEKGVGRRLSLLFGDQRKKLRILGKTIARQVILFNCAKVQLTLELRQFANQCSQKWHVGDCRRANPKHEQKNTSAAAGN